MPKEDKEKEPTEIIEQVDDGDIDKLVPSMNVSLAEPKEEGALVSDEALLGIYGEILGNLREEREEAGTLLGQFAEMVINGGDASSASKEAVVSLVKAKIDASDKMGRIADLMTRVKLKEKDTFPHYLAAKQSNTINIGNSGEKKQLIQAINKKIKADKKAKESKDAE